MDPFRSTILAFIRDVGPYLVSHTRLGPVPTVKFQLVKRNCQIRIGAGFLGMELLDPDLHSYYGSGTLTRFKGKLKLKQKSLDILNFFSSYFCDVFYVSILRTQAFWWNSLRLLKMEL